jgi:hypothetical protein
VLLDYISYNNNNLTNKLFNDLTKSHLRVYHPKRGGAWGKDIKLGVDNKVREMVHKVRHTQSAQGHVGL